MSRNTFINTVKNYKWQSVFAKYWLTSFIALLIPVIAVYIVLTNHYSDVMTSEFKSTAYDKLVLLSNETEKSFNGIFLNYSDIVGDADYHLRLYALGDTVDEKTRAEATKVIKNRLSDCATKNIYIRDIYLLVNNNKYVFSTSSIYPSDYLDTFGEDQLFYKNDGIHRYTVPYANGSQDYIVFKRKIQIGSQNIGTVIYKIDGNELLKTTGGDETNLDYYISDKYGTTLLASNDRLYKTNNPTKLAELYKRAEKKTYMISEKKSFLAASTITSYPLMIAATGSPVHYGTQQRYNRIAIWSITILTFIVAIVLSFAITTKLYNSIFEIILLLQNPLSSEKKKSKKKKNELLYIKDNIVSITEKNKRIEKELADRLMMLNSAQSTVLESQLNPHFLFNTLQLINVLEMSKFQEETDVTKAITLLADLLRYALDTTSHFVTLKTEISYNKKYIQIQNLKYGDSFETIWNIAPETAELEILKLSIQPILENAISHGVARLNGVKGYIVISSEIKGNSLVVSVKDNGKKIDGEKLKQIRQNINDVNIYKKEKIGLSNINQRMKLIFGDKYSVNITSDETGTEVTLTFPIIKN